MEPIDLNKELFPDCRPIDIPAYQPVGSVPQTEQPAQSEGEPGPEIPSSRGDSPSTKPIDDSWVLDYGEPSKRTELPYPEKEQQARLQPYNPMAHRPSRFRPSSVSMPRIIRRDHKGRIINPERCGECGRGEGNNGLIVHKDGCPQVDTCPLCSFKIDFSDGKCKNPTCVRYDEVINQFQFEESQRRAEEANVDVMKEWEEELRRLADS